MGVVYLARNLPLNRLCAIKTFSAGGGGPTAAARLRAEAEVVARLRHPNVVQIHRVAEAAGFPFLELEYLPGGSLKDDVDRCPRSPLEAARLMELVARAVAEAHRHGIIHRDLKPANVLLTADGEPKVGDFGLARSLDSDVRLTHSDQFVGTPCYMAPEQALGGALDVTPAADVYSLGAIFYELLTGYPPFRAATALQTLELVRAREPIPPRRVQPDVPRDLETVCLKCLHKDPGRRYSGADALADDLNRFLRKQPILARPTGTAERAWKWARRQPGVAALSAALMLTAALAFVLVFSQWRRAEGKAAAETEALGEARRAHREALEGQAQLAMDHGRALCEQGEIGQGMLWLSRSLRLAEEGRDDALDRAARINLADWSGRLSTTLARFRIPAPVIDLAFRPDGRMFVALGNDGALRCWDTESWRELEPPFSVDSRDAGGGFEGPIAFDPSGSGRLVVFDGEGRGQFWDSEHHLRTGSMLTPRTRSKIRGAAFTKNGQRLIAYAADGSPNGWDVPTGRPISELPRGCAKNAFAFAISADGQTMVAGGEEGRLVRRGVVTGRNLGSSPPLGSPIRRIAFLRGGQRIVVLTADGRVHVWDPESMRVSELPPEGVAITSLAVSPDGARFATGSEGGTVRLWDSTMLRQRGETLKLVEPVRCLAFRPDGLALALGLEDGRIRVSEVPQSGPISPPLRTEGAVRTVAFNRDGTHLLAVGSQGPEWWNVGPRLEKARRMPIERTGSFGVTAVSPNGRMIATMTGIAPDGLTAARIILLDADSGAVLRELPAEACPCAGLVFSPDSRQLLTWGAPTGRVSLWDVDPLGQARPLCRSLGLAIHHAAFSPDGRSLLLGCRDGKARMWDVIHDVEVESDVTPHHLYPITAVAFDPWSPRVVTGCHAGTVRLWDRTSGALLHDVRGNAGGVVAIAFSPDGKTILTASLDATARFWDVESGRQIGPALHHTDAVLCVAFNPDGRSAATGTRDGGAWLWRVPASPIKGDLAGIDKFVKKRTGLHFYHP